MTAQQPFSIGLNVAVMQVASRLFPTGYDVAEDAPDTLDKLTDHIDRCGRTVVWSGASDSTIFADREVNWAFRAWHDWCHWKHGLPFTPDGEKQVCAVQISHLKALGLWTIEREALIDAEINGQIAYHEATGDFPKDQRQLALDWCFDRHAITADEGGRPFVP